MSISKKTLNENVRTKFLADLKGYLVEKGEDVLTTGSNEIAIPTLDGQGNEIFVVVTVKVPTGSRDGEAYDGYAMQQEYNIKQAEKVEKAKANAEKKKKKIAYDEKVRQMKKEGTA